MADENAAPERLEDGDPLALRPCPFCGGEAAYADGEDDAGRWVAVGCAECGAGSSQHYPIMDDARPNAACAWDKRAAIAPHVAAEREAAWIAGRDKAVALLTYDRVFRAIGDAARFEGGRTMSISVSKFVAAFDFAALTPPSTSSLDALVAARVAEAAARLVPPGHVVVPRMDEGERNRVIGLAEICEADSTRSHFGADLADDIAQTLRKLADALYPAAKEPGHD